MADVDCLKSCLAKLRGRQSSKEARLTIETLLTIHRNILEDEGNLRFRRLRPENPTFSRKVWRFGPAQDFMHACGWVEVCDLLVFNSDEKLGDIVNVLLEHRLVVTPSESEWKEETKCENLNYSQNREEELRRKAAVQRQKELEEFQKDKVYRQQLNETIKAQIAEDRQKEWKRFTKPVVGNKLTKRTKVPSSSCVPGTQNLRR